MNAYLIKNATIVNEGAAFLSDILIENGIIKKIRDSIALDSIPVIDAKGKYPISSALFSCPYLQSAV